VEPDDTGVNDLGVRPKGGKMEKGCRERKRVWRGNPCRLKGNGVHRIETGRSGGFVRGEKGWVLRAKGKGNEKRYCGKCAWAQKRVATFAEKKKWAECKRLAG